MTNNALCGPDNHFVLHTASVFMRGAIIFFALRLAQTDAKRGSVWHHPEAVTTPVQRMRQIKPNADDTASGCEPYRTKYIDSFQLTLRTRGAPSPALCAQLSDRAGKLSGPHSGRLIATAFPFRTCNKTVKYIRTETDKKRDLMRSL